MHVCFYFFFLLSNTNIDWSMLSIALKNLLKTCIYTLWKLVQLLCLIIIIPPLINYTSLKREQPLLGQHGN